MSRAHSSLWLAGSLALLSLVPACTVEGEIDPATGLGKIKITGDDAVSITATGYEDALEKAQDHLEDLNDQTQPDPDHIDDWTEIIQGILEHKADLVKQITAAGPPLDDRTRVQDQNSSAQAK